jgi:hypothetical protein
VSPLRTLGALATLSAITALAQPTPRNAGLDEDFDERPWQEQKTQLPAYPKPENLVQLHVASTSFDFYVDAASVTVAKDEVVRYTLVARSSSGAMNVSFEGIHCKTYERKLYAFGRLDGTWAQARRPEWGYISRVQPGSQHSVLADDFFCLLGGRARTAEEAVQALRLDYRPAAAR